jgi:RHS repeat-associated protein
VQIDGGVVGTFTPAGTAYTSYATAAFTVAAGAHTLTFFGLNPLGGDNTAFLDQVQVNAVPAGRVSYAGMYYDAAGRLTDSVNVGTNGGTPWTRPASVPARSDTALVTSYVYDSAGRQTLVVDPRSIGARAQYDVLGRTTRTIDAGTAFVGADTTTQGNWQGAYGADGYSIAALSSALPSYASVTMSGQADYTWAASTTDPRALQKPGGSDRIASTWYNASTFTIDVNLTDGQAHQVSLYLLDWDQAGGGRSERIDVLDADTQRLLDTRTVPSYAGGEYLKWELSGHVQFRVTNLSGPNAVVSGLFFDPSPATAGKTVDYTYFGPSLTDTVTAHLGGAAVEQTHYVYGVSAGPMGGSSITSNDLLAAVQHPNKSTGSPDVSDADSYTYNALGEVVSDTDRRTTTPTTHTFLYDVVGRQVADEVTGLGSGVDSTVLRIETAYDSAGRPYLFTSYNATAGGTIVNQVKREYNGLGQIVTEYQAQGASGVTNSSPRVQYTYNPIAADANYSRVTSVVYPDNFTLGYNYAAGLDSSISRLSRLTDGTTTLEGYSYLGLGTVVKRTHPQSGVDLVYVGTGTGDAGDQYIGLDRFGRVVDQNWTNASGTSVDRYQYGYDRDGNRTYKDNLVNGALGELYTYDSLNQLSTFQRGTLNANKDGISGTVARSQSWSPDALGNFQSVTTDSVSQSRTHDKQNELTGVGGSTLSYDADGNLTTDETGRTFGYDAWNRIVSVNGTARYAYDALGRRIKEGATNLYYDADWQLIEEHNSGNAPVAHYVWSPVYVDAMVLRDRDADGNSANGLEERLYALADANYNVTALANVAGSVVERFMYDPYGQFAAEDPLWNPRTSSSYSWVYMHQSGRYDVGAGLYAFRYRDYSPTLMRWVSEDRLGFASGDTNLFRSARNAPGNFVDPLGLEERRIGKAFAAKLDFTGDFNDTEKDSIQAAFQQGGERIRRAYLALLLYRKEIAKLAVIQPTPEALPRVELRWQELNKPMIEYFQVNSGGISHAHKPDGSYDLALRRLKIVLDKLTAQDNVISLCPDRSPATPNLREAYIVFTDLGIVQIPGGTIHITDAFYTVGVTRRVDDVTHELGRMYLGLFDENTGVFFSDVYEWDKTLNYLNDKFAAVQAQMNK